MTIEPTIKLVINPRDKGERKHLCLQVTYNRSPRRISIGTKKTLTAEEFSNPKTKAYKEALEEAGFALSCAQQAKEYFKKDNYASFTINDFITRFEIYLKGQTSTGRITLSELKDLYFQSKPNLRPKSKEGYTAAINWVYRCSKRKNIYPADLDTDFIIKFRQFLTENITTHNGNSENSTRAYLRYLRALYKFAVSKNLASDNGVFLNQNLSSTKRENAALSNQERDAIFNYKSDDPHKQFAADFFVLTYFCSGANIGDILRLKNKNITGTIASFVRTKTQHSGITTEITLGHDAIELLNKYGKINASNPDEYILPYLHGYTEEKQISNRIHDINKQINKNLKIVCQELGIAKKVTTYNARHTFSTDYIGSGQSVEKLSQTLGHTNIKTTQTYISSLGVAKAESDLKFFDSVSRNKE